MHVVWVNQRADFVGGAERYVVDAAELLRDRGTRNTLLYDVDGWTQPAFVARFDAAFPIVDLERQLAAAGADVVYVHQIPDALDVRRFRAARAPVVRFLHDHHLFCLRETKYTTLGGRTCDRTLGAQCYPCLGFVARGVGPARYRLRTVHEVRGLHAAHREVDALVVGSRYMRDEVLAHGFDPARVHVVRPFVREPTAPTADVPREPNRLLFAGALVRGKGLDVLFQAMQRLPERARLRVAGDGAQRTELERLATSLGVAHRVSFLGRLTHEALDAEYRAAACTVVPSRSPETFSLVGPESLLRGTAVVASDVGGVREWLIDAETGLLAPSCDPIALARAVERLLDDPPLAARLGEQGRAFCREHLRRDAHADALLALFARLASRSGDAP
jgi:glycosyltransferase involved in cell wall biosynthesis